MSRLSHHVGEDQGIDTFLRRRRLRPSQPSCRFQSHFHPGGPGWVGAIKPSVPEVGGKSVGHLVGDESLEAPAVGPGARRVDSASNSSVTRRH
jgi:hypothetical protein